MVQTPVRSFSLWKAAEMGDMESARFTRGSIPGLTSYSWSPHMNAACFSPVLETTHVKGPWHHVSQFRVFLPLPCGSRLSSFVYLFISEPFVEWLHVCQAQVEMPNALLTPSHSALCSMGHEESESDVQTTVSSVKTCGSLGRRAGDEVQPGKLGCVLRVTDGRLRLAWGWRGPVPQLAGCPAQAGVHCRKDTCPVGEDEVPGRGVGRLGTESCRWQRAGLPPSTGIS